MEHDFEANFFTLLELLDLNSRLEIEAACTQKSVAAHEIICEQGEPAHVIYIVAAGVVEALTHSPDGHQRRSISVMGRGEFFGDLAVLTGHPRLASVRACEDVVLLQIEKLAFVHLLEKIPKMGAFFSRNLARRLHKATTEAHVNVYALDLSGNLGHFDLLAIFQTITGTERCGELHLHNPDNEIVGSFFFRQGRVEHARFAHLEGIEAVWQCFVQSTTDGTFTFRVMDEPSAPFSEEHRIELAGAGLLGQGASRRNAYQALPEPMRQMEGRLSRLTESLVWTDSETHDLAERIWELISKRPQPLASLWRRVNYSSLTFLEVVSQMVNTGQADLLIPAAAEEKTSSWGVSSKQDETAQT
jgi:CRP-like cAMP-binding protein